MVQPVNKSVAKKSLEAVLVPSRWMDTHVYSPLVGRLPPGVQAKIPAAGSKGRLVADSAVTYGVPGLTGIVLLDVFSKSVNIGGPVVRFYTENPVVASLETLGAAGAATAGLMLYNSIRHPAAAPGAAPATFLSRAKKGLVIGGISAALILGGIVYGNRSHPSGNVVPAPVATATAPTYTPTPVPGPTQTPASGPTAT